jgi:hypothetical protein
VDLKFTALVSTCPPNFYRIAAESIFTATGCQPARVESCMQRS